MTIHLVNLLWLQNMFLQIKLVSNLLLSTVCNYTLTDIVILNFIKFFKIVIDVVYQRSRFAQVCVFSPLLKRNVAIFQHMGFWNLEWLMQVLLWTFCNTNIIEIIKHLQEGNKPEMIKLNHIFLALKILCCRITG